MPKPDLVHVGVSVTPDGWLLLPQDACQHAARTGLAVLYPWDRHPDLVEKLGRLSRHMAPLEQRTVVDEAWEAREREVLGELDRPSRDLKPANADGPKKVPLPFVCKSCMAILYGPVDECGQAWCARCDCFASQSDVLYQVPPLWSGKNDTAPPLEGWLNCESCGYVGEASAFTPNVLGSIHNAIRCPSCGSTRNRYNRVHSRWITERIRLAGRDFKPGNQGVGPGE